ncbi:MAG: ABC transporter ATP-binding protein [Sulfobacillus benefaciens]|uniref:ABC transporter ATP-binding protein n=1 Tax=Sulfobacillus benefaciens TaxID=453960 RepID=A0A2T2X748_9FIRM|nr:MAG: ABC transporter ATP-binding protein [Sulfobacillus benefaciens]
MTSGLSFNQVKFRWGKQSDTFGPITGRIAQGSFVGLIGPNGAGKSTLLRLSAAYLKPTAGEISLFDRPIAQMTPSQRARLVSVVPQSLSTNFDLTVEEVVELGRLSHLNLRQRFAPVTLAHRQAVSQAMEATGVVAFSRRPFSALSGGEAQRVLLAMALAQNTPLLLLDEPTAHLDPGHARHFLELVQELVYRQHKTVLMAYHDLATVGLYCDALWLMHQGQVLMTGNPETVLSSPLISQVYETGFVHLSHPRSHKPMLLFP